MTDTTESAPAQASLSDLRMPELQQLATRLGIKGISKMRKPELVEAIRERRRANGQRPRAAEPTAQTPPLALGDEERPARAERTRSAEPAGEGQGGQAREGQGREGQAREGQRDGDRQGGRKQRGGDQQGRQQREQGQQRDGGQRDRQQGRQQREQTQQRDEGADADQKLASLDEIIHFPEPTERREEPGRSARRATRPQGGGNGGNDQRDDSNDDGDDDERPGRRRRGRDRYRDRKRRQTGREGAAGTEDEVEILEDDVLVPVAGILDVLDNYAFVRTSGYLPGASDVYVSLGQVKKAGLRRGDAVTGAVRQPREGESQRQKFNALVRLDTVNGAPVEEAVSRPEFGELTPLHPEERLRLETGARETTGRVVDLVAPLGKGQRALVVTEPRAGATATLQQLATAITTNHPEVHLMVVLVDGRPEEVTDWQRSVQGEVIASPFDRPAADHTSVAELAIERAKRLVELGQDVVILLDSLTRLARAYNVAAPPSGRQLVTGVDAGALYPPKRFFGAARNVENGGSLTIVATASVGTGSAVDEAIFEELGGTWNAEVRLVRALADRRLFPAVDPTSSSTAHEELLLTPDELAAVRKLRNALTDLEPRPALERLLTRVRQTGSNAELLLSVSRTDGDPLA
ncbi:MAG TPA: transcription termination factor Rho [Actinotalea caeni]|uniref:transcription termination factor Rho n=1 Tax=Actinotalea caeni TaxID=1348467 RepID=UPI002B4B67E1|nr:transcription termination factor Rho [Actinotalea caeni]HLV55313.1 transcription termination factor Rho [Actinotalea caeni]